MKNWYLAGPMRGLKDYNFPAFDFAAEKLREEGYTVFSPADNDRETDNQGPSFDIRRALRDDTRWICLYADAVALLPGWENSKGAKAEIALAEALGLTVVVLGAEYVEK
jgi:hypothetical protein